MNPRRSFRSISRLFATTILLVYFSTIAIAADFYVVAHHDVADKELSRETIERIFLGKKSRWSNGDKLVPVMLKKGPLHEQFIKRMVNRDATQFNTYWKQAVFTGRGLPPKSFDSLDELLDYIMETPGTIGYASSPPQSDSLIVIKIR